MNEDLIPLLDLTPATSLALVWSSDRKQMTLSQRAAAKSKVKFELEEERGNGFGCKENLQNCDLCLFLCLPGLLRAMLF